MKKTLCVVKCEYRKCEVKFLQTVPFQRFCSIKHAQQEKNLKRQEEGYIKKYNQQYMKQPRNFLRKRYYNYKEKGLLKYSTTPEDFIERHILRPDFNAVYDNWITNPTDANLPMIVRLWEGDAADGASVMWVPQSLHREPRKNFSGQTIKGRYIIEPVAETMHFSESARRIWTVQCLSCNKIYDMVESGFTGPSNTAERCRDCAYQERQGEKSYNYKGYKDLRGSYLSKMRLLSARRGRPFTVDVKFLWELFQKQDGKCALSGVPIHFSPDYAKWNQTASLDRIDSNGGYTPDNVQWVHKDLNRMKSNFTQEQFIEYCTMVAKKAGNIP